MKIKFDTFFSLLQRFNTDFQPSYTLCHNIKKYSK